MRYITTTTMAIKFNGYTSQSFRPARGLRQEDLLSPLVFKLCMVILSEFIKETCSQGRWKAIHFNNHFPVISHMTFADDIVIFREIDLHNIQSMINTIEWFCQASG